MEKRKWSKGPWYADDLYVGTAKNHSMYDGTKENGKRVKDIESFWNARLISAAPEMYEAIYEVLGVYGDQIKAELPELHKELEWCLLKVGA